MLHLLCLQQDMGVLVLQPLLPHLITSHPDLLHADLVVGQAQDCNPRCVGF